MFTLRQLDFDADSRRSRSTAVDACTVVGVIVVFYYIMTLMMKPKDPYPSPRYFSTPSSRTMQQFGHHVRGMVGRFASAKAARHSNVFGDAADHYTEISKSQHIALIQAGLATKADAAKITASDKADCQAALLRFVQQKGKAIIMVFAPWCGHCHNMMPVFGSTCMDMNAIMVNGDCLPDDVMAGTSSTLSIPAVGYYPFLMVYKNHKFTKVASPDEAVEMYNADDASPSNGAEGDAEGDAEGSLGMFETVMSARRNILQPDSKRFVTEQDASPSRGMPALSSNAHTDTSFMDNLF